MKNLRVIFPSLAWALLFGLGLTFQTLIHADELSTFSAHDPSRMIYDPVGNRWLIFYTGNGVPFAVSTDQKTWTHVNTNRVFPSSGTGADNTDYWAPDMWGAPIHGQYLLFYSLSSFGSQTHRSKSRPARVSQIPSGPSSGALSRARPLAPA